MAGVARRRRRPLDRLAWICRYTGLKQRGAKLRSSSSESDGDAASKVGLKVGYGGNAASKVGLKVGGGGGAASKVGLMAGGGGDAASKVGLMVGGGSDAASKVALKSLIGNNHLSAGFLVHCPVEEDSNQRDGKHYELVHHQRGQVSFLFI